MERLGGIGFSNTSSTTKKKRSTTVRRPSSLPSTPIPDNNEREAVESDEGSTNGSFQGSNQVSEHRAENVIKKVKLKLGGSSKTITASDNASDIGLCSTKSSDEASDSKTDAYPIRKSNRLSKRRVLDEELEDDDDDEEIRFLKKVKMAKSMAVDEDDGEERRRKLKKLSKVMKQNVKYPKVFHDVDYVKDDDDEEEEAVSDVELGNKSARTRRRDVQSEVKMTTRRRSGHSGSLIEFPGGLPPAPPRKRKENGVEVDQQVKKAEAAQRRKIQVEKAARESEAEAIRKILGQDSSRKKKEDQIKKRQEEKAKEKAADTIARRSDTVKWVMGPSGTVVTFPEELGLPTIFNSRPHSYPPPREVCAGPECTNPYKYRDSESNLPLCSLRCYKAIKG